MNLVDQIFAQAKAGSAEGQGFGQFFAEGVQAGQRQQALDVQKQQLAMEIAQAPLKQTLLEQHARLNEYGLATALHQQEDQVETKSAIADLMPQVAQAWREGKQDQVPGLMAGTLAKYPGAKDDPIFVKVANLAETATKAKAMEEHYKAIAEERHFQNMPPAARFETLAKQAEADGDPDTAAMYREHAGLELQREERLQKQAEDVHLHNQIRLKQLEEKIMRTKDKAALEAFQSKLRNIENAPKLKLAERNKQVADLLQEYEGQYGSSTTAPAAPTAPSAMKKRMIFQNGQLVPAP